MYAYCLNNPVNCVDPTGNAPEWLKWLGIGLAIVGTILVVGAIAALTMGVGTTIMASSMAGAVIHGAALGTLFGASVGVVAGGIIGGAVSGWSAEGILIGMGIGFGGGAIIGAVVGGAIGGIHYQNHQQVLNYISQYARNADDANEIYRSFDGKIRLKTSNGKITAYRYYDNVNAFQRGRYLTNATTSNPIRDLVLYKNNATMLARFNIPKGTQYLVGIIAGSPVNAIQYFVGDLAKLILLV